MNMKRHVSIEERSVVGVTERVEDKRESVDE